MSVTTEVEVHCTKPGCAEMVYSNFPMRLVGQLGGYVVDRLALHTYLVNSNWQWIHGDWWCPKCAAEIKTKEPDHIIPPDGEANIIVMVKDLKDPYAALYLPDDMGGMVHIHGLGDTSNRPWSDVVRWWPFPTPEQLDFIRGRQ